jgi:hypothetical protein
MHPFRLFRVILIPSVTGNKGIVRASELVRGT